MSRFLLLSAIALVAAAPAADAQIFMSQRPAANRGAWGFDIALQYAQPVHGFASNVERAWGIGSSLHHHFAAVPFLGLRGDFSYLNYGNERQRVPLSSTVNRVFVEMNTSNNIVFVGGGPELAVPQGPVRPYIHGFAGYSYFFTQSSAGDDNGGGSFASTTNYDDGGFASGGGAGIRIPLQTRRTSVAIDGGARFTRNGERSYLRTGDIIDQPDGSLTFTPRFTEADYWTYYLGASITLGRSRRR
ncbi:MAG TPA: hypothetical protein VEB19_09455 [Gemmatimonadaceae bacterium]|nr:hypothetical protein [Gemmatimonadaceae bacterium]